MRYKILSKKRNKVLALIRWLILVAMLISGFVIIENDSLIAKLIFGVILLYNISPLSLLGKKYIGELNLGNTGISFITQDGEFIDLKFKEILELKLFYFGCKGDIEFFYRGLYWNQGENRLKIKTELRSFDLSFLSIDTEDKNEIVRYADVLIDNNVIFIFDIDGDVLENG